MADFETILFAKSDGVAKITLNRPDAANGINLQLAKDLMSAASDCDDDPDVRAVILTGNGKLFCAGGDLKSMEGGWRFQGGENEDGIVVTHEIRVRPKLPVPRWLLRRSMRKDVPDMLACLRGLTNGSGLLSREKDLGRCPRQKKKK